MTKKEKEIFDRIDQMLDQVLDKIGVLSSHQNGQPDHDFSNISDDHLLANKK